MKEIKIVDIVSYEGKPGKILTVKISKSFKKWFCTTYDLKRFSKSKFQKVFLESVKDTVPSVLNSVRKVEVLVE